MPALGLSFFIFLVLLEFAHRLEIRLFFRRRKLKILRIRGFKNHYRVEYMAGGNKVSGKWQKDFQNWQGQNQLGVSYESFSRCDC